MDEMRALLTEIHRSSFHDGPGVRTVFFFKGCHLRCAWCHNPENLDFRQEVRRWSDFSDPLEIREEPAGISYTLRDLMEEAEKDRVWYGSTGGGVTLSGGEALAQGDFALAFLEALGKAGIHRAVETSGVVKREILERSLDHTDLFLMDWKCSDRESLKKWTGADLNQVRESLELLVEHNKIIHLRLPVIPGINDNEYHWETIGRLARFDQIKRVEIMAYHNWGRNRYAELGYPLPPDFPVPTRNDLTNWKEILARKIPPEKLIS